MLLTDQHTSFLTAFLGCPINLLKDSNAPASIACWVSSSEPVRTLPKVLKQATAIARWGWSNNYTNLGSTLVYISIGICVLPPSLMYDIAQQISVRISSESFCIKTLARLGIHLLTCSKFGAGLPLQKLAKVQLAFLTKLQLPGMRSSMLAIGFTAPALITKSLIFVLSHAKFPKPQIACSTTSMFLELSNLTKASTVPLEHSTWTWSWSPLATLVKHQAASNCILGKSSLVNIFKNFGIKLASITCCIGG